MPKLRHSCVECGTGKEVCHCKLPKTFRDLCRSIRVPLFISSRSRYPPNRWNLQEDWWYKNVSKTHPRTKKKKVYLGQTVRLTQLCLPQNKCFRVTLFIICNHNFTLPRGRAWPRMPFLLQGGKLFFFSLTLPTRGTTNRNIRTIFVGSLCMRSQQDRGGGWERKCWKDDYMLAWRMFIQKVPLASL